MKKLNNKLERILSETRRESWKQVSTQISMGSISFYWLEVIFEIYAQTISGVEKMTHISLEDKLRTK